MRRRQRRWCCRRAPRRVVGFMRALENTARDHILARAFDELRHRRHGFPKRERGRHARRCPGRRLGDERIEQDPTDQALERRRDGKDRRRRHAHRAGDLGVRPRVSLGVGRAEAFGEALGVSRRQGLGHRHGADAAGGANKTANGCAYGTAKSATRCRAGSAPTEPRRNDRSRATDAAAQIIHEAPIVGRRRSVRINGKGLSRGQAHGVAHRLLGAGTDAREQICERARLGWIGRRGRTPKTPDARAGRGQRRVAGRRHRDRDRRLV